MTSDSERIKLFVYPRMFAIPNLSPFCCKLETWLRIAEVPYELVPDRSAERTSRQAALHRRRWRQDCRLEHHH